MKNIIVGGVATLALGAVAGCDRKPTEPGNIPPGAEVGALRVLLASETPSGQLDPRVEEVGIRIDGVEARHEDEGWVTISEERQDFDLMGGAMDDDDPDPLGGAGADDGGVDELPNAMAERIGQGEVWTGTYSKIHLGVADAWIVIDGAQQDLEFIGNIDPLDPFDTGLTVNESFFVDQDSVTTVRILWDLGPNLREKDNGVWSLGAETRVEVDIEERPSGVVDGDAGGRDY